MKTDYLTLTNQNPEATEAIVLIPDIWGMTEYSQATAQSLAHDHDRPCYTLDYFYQLTSRPSKFNPTTDASTATGLMESMHGEDFVEIFKKAVARIKISQPKLKSIQVVGFCFGGRLAYLTGLEKMVNKIVVFYGAGANQQGFYDGSSVVASLCSARKSDASLNILAFFGSQDDSIPPEDRQKIEQTFREAGINYEHHEYEAGHAYFQKGRPNFDAIASVQSKKELDNFLAR